VTVRYLIINADDLGLCPQVDEGILEVVRAGRVSSVSLLVNPPFRPLMEPFKGLSVSVGLHLNLTMGFPLSSSGLVSLRLGDGRFAPRWYEESPPIKERELRDEFLRQVEAFQALVGSLPTHLDTHKHIHIRSEEVFDMAADLAKSLDIPLRAQDEAVRATLRDRGILVTDHFVGGVEPSPFWTEERLSATLKDLQPGTTEMMCHPGRGMPEMEGLRYTHHRDVEREALLSPASGRLLVHISLATFVTAPLHGIDHGV
jgi:chitin disaccharide deacetylase